jgi:hypothetical protein
MADRQLPEHPEVVVKPLFEASAYVPAPLEDLIPQILHLEPGPVTPATAPYLAGGVDRAGWTVSGGPEKFDVYAGGTHLLYVDVNRTTNTIGMQGHWWYRGEYSLVAEPPGCRVTYRVFNVAPRGRWAVPLANRLFIGYQATVQKSVDDFAARFAA